MRIEDDRIRTYVGLNNTGEVVQYFSDCDEFENAIDSVVSIGYVEAIPIEYDEVYQINNGQPEVQPSYDDRVRAYEAQGMTRSDAQAVVDAENMQ